MNGGKPLSNLLLNILTCSKAQAAGSNRKCGHSKVRNKAACCGFFWLQFAVL